MNKKIIAISLLVIVAAISISGCLGPNEDETYNAKMTEIYNDFKMINETLNEAQSTQTVANSADDNELDKLLESIDNVTLVINNDTQKLKDLKESINNDTRKEYITLCIGELDEVNKMMNITKELLVSVKDYQTDKITLMEFQDKFTKFEAEINKINKTGTQTEKKIRDYEKKYPFVLINGTQSLFDNDTITNEY